MNTNNFLNRVAGNVFGTQTSPALPTGYYLGLSKTAPNVSGGNVTEPTSGTGYQRVHLTTSALSTPSNGVVTNTSAISFNESTSSWGTISHFVIFDAATSGNLLMYGALSSPRTVDSATVMTIREGDLTLSVVNPT